MERFNTKTSPMRDIYEQLDVVTPKELSDKFTELDQELMRNREWDYENDELVLNKLKEQLENVDAEELTDEESRWRNEILWFWYHHATSMALFGYKDDEQAGLFAEKALSYQADDHPNKLTKLLQILSSGDVVAAETYSHNFVTKEPEKSSAIQALDLYRKVRLNYDIVEAEK